MLTKIMGYFGYIKKSQVDSSLNFARSVAKRLDEHRETVQAIGSKTELLKDDWHIVHLATQDDYLMRIYHLVHGQWPNDDEHNRFGYVRKRPLILGQTRLPELTSKVKDINL